MTQALDTLQANDNGNDERSISVPARLPYPAFVYKAFGIDRGTWKALVEAVFPQAQSIDSVVLALSYCRGRKLDVMKRVVHIVPIYSREKGCMVDTIWPGIGELRTTAFRTGEYAGRDPSEFGPDIKQKIGSVEMTFPEWGQVTVYRMVRGQRVAFAGPRVYWLETYAVKSRSDDSPNEMWATRPRGQIDKCAEAAALRAAFPEEIGSDYIPEEVEHQRAKPVSSLPVNSRAAIAQFSEGTTAAADESGAPGTQSDPFTQHEPTGPAVASPAAPESAASGGAEEAEQEPHEQPESPWPTTLPDQARTSTDWINDVIISLMPGLVSAHTARKVFHGADVNSWEKLPPARQDEKYQQLITGTFVWKK